MKRNKVAKLMVVAALVGAIGIGGSLALLTARSEAVTNTFTVGKGLHDTDITLDEAQVNENGEEIDGAERVQKNTYQNLEQGDGLDKDPTVTIKDTAADCYVFVLVDGLKKNTSIYDVDIEKSWMKVERIPKEIQDQVPDTADLYVYKSDQSTPTVVRGGLTAGKGIVFDGVKIKDDAALFEPVMEEGTITGYKAKNLDQIIVKACAVQATNNSYENALKLVTFANTSN